MKVYQDIEQKSEEWFLAKWGKIGGTLSKGLFVDSDTLFIDILSQRLEEYEPVDSYENEAMQRGNNLEPFAVEYLEKYLDNGTVFETFGWLESEENELLGISPDGMTSDFKLACETKCFGRKQHLEVILSGEIPKEFIPQAVHYFTVNPKLEKLYWTAFRPETVKSVIIEVTRDTELDMGWKKKIEIPQFGAKGQSIKPKIKSVPDIRTVGQWTEISLSKAEELLKLVRAHEDSLSF